jgi:hypothetical protein
MAKAGGGVGVRDTPAAVSEGFGVRLRRVFTPLFLFKFILRQRHEIICKGAQTYFLWGETWGTRAFWAMHRCGPPPSRFGWW